MPCRSLTRYLDRIIALKKLKNDAGLARFLNVKPAIISNWRTRGTIPYDIIVAFCEHEGIGLDYVVSGRGPVYLGDRIRESGAESGSLGDRVAETVNYRPEYDLGHDEFVYISQVMGRISAGRGRIPETP